MGVLLKAVSDLTTKQIEEFAQENDSEDKVLAALGCDERQAGNVKRNKRWRKHWKIGSAKGGLQKSKEMFNSKDSTILKLYADKVIPAQEKEDIILTWDWPKYMNEELDVNKVKKARKDV